MLVEGPTESEFPVTASVGDIVEINVPVVKALVVRSKTAGGILILKLFVPEFVAPGNPTEEVTATVVSGTFTLNAVPDAGVTLAAPLPVMVVAIADSV
jgi:hypothetical protein